MRRGDDSGLAPPSRAIRRVAAGLPADMRTRATVAPILLPREDA